MEVVKPASFGSHYSRRAFVLEGEHIRKICELIASGDVSPEISIDCADGKQRRTSYVEELIGFANHSARKIVRLTISQRFGSNPYRSIVVHFSETSVSFEIPSSIEDADLESIKEGLDDIFEEIKSGRLYSFFSKGWVVWTVFAIALAPLIWQVIFLSIEEIMQLTILIWVFLPFVSVAIYAWLQKMFFPAACFAIGQQKKSLEKRRSFLKRAANWTGFLFRLLIIGLLIKWISGSFF